MKEGQKPGQAAVIEQQETGSQFIIESWKPEEAEELFAVLEEPNWAPWLAASSETLAGRAQVFPAGQLVMRDGVGSILASLSLNQINWDGNPQTLPTWDEVAGDPTDYSMTYIPDGNTLVLLSMNVHPDYQGQRLPSKMIDTATDLAKQLNVQHLIGSFRPSDYGMVKQGLGNDLDFWEYCLMKRSNSSKPVDHWLGSLWHMGMKMMAVDDKAMVVVVNAQEFEGYKTAYQPSLWKEVESQVWECGEVGHWVVDANTGLAIYQESNVWGSLPLK
jgi:GNAT superfamily N-acetyltransferase